MIIPFLILLVIIAVGTVIYIYFRQEQEKVIPKNKYEGAQDEAYLKRQTWIKHLELKSNKASPALASLISFNQLSILIITFGIALLATMFSVGVVYDIVLIPYISAILILFSPVSLPMFPSGLIAVITQTYNDSAFGAIPLITGWFTYFSIFLLGIFIKNRRVFAFIYFTFIILLIMNIAGCSKITPEFLSGIN